MKFLLSFMLLINLAHASDDIDNLLKKARSIDLKNKNSSGFVIKEVTPNSIFSRFGLQSGDVINKLNGKKVESLSDVMNINIDEAKSIQITRNKEIMSYKLN